MKNYDWFLKTIVTAFIILGSLHLYSLYGAGFPVNQVVTQKENIFSVSGEGKVTATPNVANISLGVTAEAATALAAQDQANQVMNRLIDQLKSQGIEDRDIETTNYSIFPQYGFVSTVPGPNRITGYSVNINLTVHVRDLDKLNNIVDIATAAGSNQVGNIELTLSDEKRNELLKEAREKAVAEAKEKAEALAKAAGLTLGRVINVQESGGSVPPIPLRAELALDVAKVGAPTQIEPGSTEIVSQVTLFYETR